MEVVVVIFLLGILSIVLVPIVNSTLISTRTATIAEVMAEDIRLAKQIAQTTHDSIWVVFNATDDKYSVYEGPSEASRSLIKNPGTQSNWVVLFSDPQYKGADITSESFGTTGLLFNQWGDAASSGTIVLNSGDVTVTVTELTGKVEVDN